MKVGELNFFKILGFQNTPLTAGGKDAVDVIQSLRNGE